MSENHLLDVLIEKVTGLETGLREMKTELVGIKELVSDLQSGAIGLKGSLLRLEDRLESIFEETEDLIEFRTKTTKILLEIKENQLSMADMLGDHEIQIRNLKRRVGQSV